MHSLYGGGADKLAKVAKISEARAQEILDDYFQKYAGVKAWIDSTTRFVINKGYSLSPLGRKRRVPEVNSDDNNLRAKAIRQAVNSIIQSFASDGLMLSACNLLDHIEENDLPITILGPIHDALYIEVSGEYMVEAKDIMLGYMEELPVPADIPMVADAEFGERWSEFEEFTEVTSDNYEDDDEEEMEEAA